MSLAAAVGVANEGAKLFASGDHNGAAALFTAALEALPAFDAERGDAQDEAEAAVALSRARALNNRASCALRTGAPLRALDDTADALALLLDPERAGRGLPAVRSGGRAFTTEALGVALTSVLKRAAAYEAAGTPVAALPLVSWAAAQPSGIKLRDTAVRLLGGELAPPVTASGALPSGVAPARGGLLPLAAATGCPPGRRGGVGACVAGHLYVLGGQRDDFSDAPEFWRVPVVVPATGGAPWDWQRLGSPNCNGGPESTRHALLAGCDATAELLCLSERRLWAVDVAELTWRHLGEPFPGADGDRGDLQGPALTSLGDAALVYAPEHGLVRVCLRSGERTLLWKPGPQRRRAPCVSSPLLWPAGDAALLLWGGTAPEGRGSMELPGHNLISPPPLGDMWRFDLSSKQWSRLPRQGGGAPPAPRAEAALAPLAGGGFEPGSAVIVGGYSELLPQLQGAYPGPICGYRYCDDAHVYTPASGWRRLAPTGPRATPAAAVACGFAAHASGNGGAVFCCGGYSSLDGALSHAQVRALALTPAVLVPGPAPPAQAGPARDVALRAVALALLNHPESEQIPHLPLPDDMFAFAGMRYNEQAHAGTDWSALLARAAALPRGSPGSQAVVTWQETQLCDADRSSPMFQMSTTRNDVQARDVTDFYFVEPEAPDVARQLLLLLAPAPGGGAALPRPVQVLFASRVGAETMRQCAPLLELLGMAPVLEPWAAAAESSLMHNTNPWGYNCVRRCVRCKRGADGRRPGEPPQVRLSTLKLRSCGECKLASYCGADCQRADWGHHKEMCRFACEWKREHGKA